MFSNLYNYASHLDSVVSFTHNNIIILDRYSIDINACLTLLQVARNSYAVEVDIATLSWSIA